MLLVPGSAFSLTGVEKAQMIEAARADCYAQMIRQIKGLQVTDNTLVANHVTDSSYKEAFAQALIKGAQLSEPEFIGDICVINGKMTIEQIVENVNRITKKTGGVTVSDFSNIKRFNRYQTIGAQGVGTVAAKKLSVSESEPIDQNRGLKETINTLSGNGQQKLAAIESARIDAYAQLARQIKGLELTDQSVVYDMAENSRWTTAMSNALIKGAFVERYSAMDKDLAVCVVAINMQRVVENVRKVTNNSKSFASVHRKNTGIVKVTATGYGAVGSGQLNEAPAIIGTVQ